MRPRAPCLAMSTYESAKCLTATVHPGANCDVEKVQPVGSGAVAGAIVAAIFVPIVALLLGGIVIAKYEAYKAINAPVDFQTELRRLVEVRVHVRVLHWQPVHDDASLVGGQLTLNVRLSALLEHAEWSILACASPVCLCLTIAPPRACSACLLCTQAGGLDSELIDTSLMPRKTICVAGLLL